MSRDSEGWSEEWLAERLAKQGKPFPQVKSAPEFSAAVKVNPLVIAAGPEWIVAAKPSRERNRKIIVDGEKYDSKWEFTRHQQLKTEERAGVITGLQRQVEYTLAPSVVILGRKRPPLRYFLDFQYVRDGVTVYEDAKGKVGATDTYRIKRHLMKSVHNIDITEVRK